MAYAGRSQDALGKSAGARIPPEKQKAPSEGWSFCLRATETGAGMTLDLGVRTPNQEANGHYSISPFPSPTARARERPLKRRVMQDAAA
jgi:hypothetical protein